MTMTRPNPLREIVFAAIAGGASVALSACEGETVISNSFYDTQYYPFAWSSSPVFPVVVRGNPYAVPKAEFDQAVADAMQGTTFGTVNYFVPAPQSIAAYRVIMLFNQPANVGASTLCTLPGPPDAVFGGAPETRVGISAALCLGERSITQANGYIATVGGPRGEDFRRGVQRFSMALFPGFKWDKGNGGNLKPR